MVDELDGAYLLRLIVFRRRGVFGYFEDRYMPCAAGFRKGEQTAPPYAVYELPKHA